MSTIDWVIMLLTLVAMTCYGLWKSRGQTGLHSYLLAGNELPWHVILLGVMATQASAITFLSAPGYAYNDGLRFVQNYFGLPIAMVVIAAFFVPAFHRMKIYTAYEYLERRFDKKTRKLTAFLFLLSRGLSTGISIYAPSIILSSILGCSVYITNLIVGGILLLYTYTGGAKAVAHTQKLQFLIILSAMGYTGWLIASKMPEGVDFGSMIEIAGVSGKLNAVTTNFDWKDKYNVWSGTIGGFFLALSYFGTDHSQVGRYISAKSEKESKLGLLLNGIVKIPMQLGILFIGVLVYLYYIFAPTPIHYKSEAVHQLKVTEPIYYQNQYEALKKHQKNASQLAMSMIAKEGDKNDTKELLKGELKEINSIRKEVSDKIYQQKLSVDKSDSDYVFIYFIKNNLPVGLVGLLFAVIILASWGSISAALNSLAASSLMDIHIGDRTINKEQQLKLGRKHTLGWGLFCIATAMFAAQLGSLIEAVNILGSLFYGTILGIFLVAFMMPKVSGNAVYIAAIITEILIITIYLLNGVSFLWLNAIGAIAMCIICLPNAMKSKWQGR